MRKGLQRLAHRDIGKVLDVVLNLQALRDRATFIDYALDSLNDLIPCDRISYNEIDLEQGKAKIVWTSDEALLTRMQPVFEAYMYEHPLIKVEDKTRVYKLSDFVTQTHLRGMGLYQDYYRLLGTTHQLGFVLQRSSKDLVPFVLNRGGHDFSERDRAVVALLSPHLVQAMQRAEQVTKLQAELALLRMGLKSCGIEAARISSAGRIVERSEALPVHFKRYFPDHAAEDELPLRLWDWMIQRREADAAIVTPRRPLQLSCSTHQATIRHARHEDDHVLIIEEVPSAIPPAALIPLGLRQREAEVLSWVAQGKTNVEISMILGISARTVQKHLEHVLYKLDCETRTAAAVQAMEAARLFTQH